MKRARHTAFVIAVFALAAAVAGGGVLVFFQRCAVTECRSLLAKEKERSDAYRQKCLVLAGRLYRAREIVERDRGEAEGVGELCEQSLEVIDELTACLWPLEDGFYGRCNDTEEVLPAAQGPDDEG